MNLTDLKNNTTQELIDIAKEMGLDNMARSRKQDIIFAVLKRHGIVKDNRTGYSIGLSYPPDWGEHTMSLRSGDHTELCENMTFHFMPGLWMDTWGLETTESIVIGAKGPEFLSAVPRKLMIKD